MSGMCSHKMNVNPELGQEKSLFSSASRREEKNEDDMNIKPPDCQSG